MASEFKNNKADPYAVLGVPRSASPGAIRRAYKQKALATHPDKGGTAEKFRLVVRAFEVLGSHECRDLYDSSMISDSKTDDKVSHASSSPKARRTKLGNFKARNCARKATCKRPRREQIYHQLRYALELLRKAIAAHPKEVRQALLGKLFPELRKTLAVYMLERSTKYTITEITPSLDSSDIDSHGRTSSEESCSGEDEMSDFPLALTLPCLSCAQFEERLQLALCHPAGAFPSTEGQRKQQAARQSRSRSGIMGISCIGSDDRRLYRAKVAASTIIMTSRTRHTLEESISDHVVLVHMREELRSALKNFDGNVDYSHAQLEDLVHALEEGVERVFSQNLICNNVQGFCSFTSRISQPYIRGTLDTNPTRSVAECIRQRRKLIAARDSGWDSFRSAWIDMTQADHSRIVGLRGKARLTAQAVAASLDVAYKQHAPWRDRAAERLREKMEKEHLRQGASEERQSARAAQMYDRAISKATRAFERQVAFFKNEEEMASKEALRKQAAQDRLREREHHRIANERMKWHRRGDLTMADILNGPPM